MNEITPSLVAEIATRLFNEVPGAGSVPKTESDVRHLPGEVAQLPSSSMPTEGFAPPVSPSLPAHYGTIPSTVAPVSASTKPMYPSTPTSPTTALAEPPLLNFASLRPMAPVSSFENPAAAAAPSSAPHFASAEPLRVGEYEGLRSFVQSLRTSGTRPADDGRPGVGNFDFFPRFDAAKLPTNGGSRPFDVNAIRADFPILKQRVHGRPLAWLDNAATTQKPQSVIDAISRFYANDNSNIHRAAHTLAARATDAYEQARRKVQAFLGASSTNEIIFVRGTTEGINLVASTYGRKFLQPGDEIVLSLLEHHASIVPWQMVAKQTGAVLRVIPVNDRGEVMLEEYQRLLGPRTRMVSLTQASNSLGTILPVAEMTQMAKRYNARVLIDGAQSVAHIPVNMQQLGADFFVFSGHKIFGPTGIGVVYAKEEVQEIMPPYQGGGNMIKSVTFEETTYNDPPAKFEAGTPNIADAVGLGAALDYVNQLGLPNIAAYEHKLLEYGTERLARIDGLRLIGTAREKVGVMSFVLPERKTEEVGKALDQEGIAVRAGHHCAQPSLRRFGVESTVRPSLAFYNTCEEIDRLVDAVKRILRR